MKRLFILIAGSALVLPSMFAQQNGTNNSNGSNFGLAIPYVFVGKAGDCGTGTPAGSRIVTSAWLAGMGLPDDGTSVDGTASSRTDPHFGLLLSKNGPTADCSSAGAVILTFGQFTVPTTTTAFQLGFDFRNGTHCGAGAPRFNIVTSDGATHFAGCADGTITPAPQDPAQWSRVRFTPAQLFPPVLPGAQIKTVSIVYDEGTDTPSTQDPMGVGLSVLDNIDVNGHIITGGFGPGAGAGQDNNSNTKNGDDKQNDKNGK